MKPQLVHVSPGPRQEHALVAKYLNCLVEANGDHYLAEQVAELRAPALTVLPKIHHTKANVGALPLGANDPFNFSRDVYTSLIVSDLRALLARFQKVPPRVKVPVENAAGGNAAWVGQGLPTAVTKSTTSGVTLDVFQMAAITVITRELFRFGVDSENTFMRIIRDDVSRFYAAALFDSTKAAASGNPASLTNGATSVTSTGTTAAQMIADLNNLIANILTALVDPAFVMRPKTFYRIAATLAGVGLNVTRDNLLGIPVTLLSGMPREVVLVDCASVLLAADDAVELDTSAYTTIEMSDAPGQSGISGTGAQAVSMWQTGNVAVSATLTTNWANAYFIGSPATVPSGVTYMTTAY